MQNGKEESKKQKVVPLVKKEGAKPKESLSAGTGLFSFLSQKPHLQKSFILFVVSMGLALIISPNIVSSVYDYDAGEIARSNVKAPHDFLVQDFPSTEKKKEETGSASLSVYDFDDGAATVTGERISKSFLLMRQYLAEIEGNAGKLASLSADKQAGKRRERRMREAESAYLEESRNERKQAFDQELGLKIDEKTFLILEKQNFSSHIEDILRKACYAALVTGIVESREFLRQEMDKGIVVRSVGSQKEAEVKDISEVVDLNSARLNVVNEVKSYAELWKDKEITAFASMASSLIKPNLTLNKNETEARREKAVNEVGPVFFQVKAGEMILREGERVTAEHIVKLKALSGGKKSREWYHNLFGMFLLISALIYALYYFATSNIRKITLETKDLLFLALLLMFSILFFDITMPITDALSNVFPAIPASAYRYFFTVSASAILVRIVLNSEVAIIFSIAVSVLTAMMMKNNLYFGIYSLVGCIVGAQVVRFCKYRVTLIKAGFHIGLANAAMVIVFGLLSDNPYSGEYSFGILFAFLGGIMTGVLVTGLTPIIESLFSYTTNFKLLELASLDHPLLKDLITQSPGTYHHSWIIGNLVETAAEAIHANPLLAKVSALYHDIGKMKKPQYFFENQKGGRNPHDKLAPSLSSLIIIGHVKDGMELAKEYKLGKEITDIIPQHHGTRLIRLFYQKAKDQEDPHVHSVNEKDFRYPGPKPQTKEAGLVMLADAVEAAARTIQEPTPARIQSVVKKIIGDIFADGQLDECELTLKDMNEIAKSFNRILNGIFHARIDYPDPDDEGKKGIKVNDGTDKRKKETDRGKQGKDQENGGSCSAPLAVI
ncbi:MAG: HDIG domain-containing protein [Deltaproteobacteria bacterium]|nr:HDIG domain-containing protein [Deltaproteobacteria bacterium]